MKIKILPLLLLLMLTNSLGAKILLPEIMSDNMVLQQNTKVNLWGKSDSGKTVEIRPSWTAEFTKVKVDAKEIGSLPLLHLQQVLLHIPFPFQMAKNLR
jgi:sialate O-acetylesterase